MSARSSSRGRLVALPTQLRHEGLGDPDPSTGFGDIFQDVEQVGSDGGEERRSPHAERPFALSSALLAARSASRSSSETSPPAAIEASSLFRSAASLASRSSTSRSPSRTTSLAEP